MPSTLHRRASAPTMMGTASSPAATTATVTKTVAAAEMMPFLAQELARELAITCASPLREMDTVARYHNHEVDHINQCCSAVVRRISAPLSTVWDLVRRFDQPQTYKHFLRSCRVIAGHGAQVGCLREVHVVSGLPASSSTERLEVLDEENHVIGFRVVGGEHRLQNYHSVTSLHPSIDEDGNEGTLVVESYVVDIPKGNTKEETCVFVDTIVTCNLHSLSRIAQKIATSSSISSSSSSSSCKVS